MNRGARVCVLGVVLWLVAASFGAAQQSPAHPSITPATAGYAYRLDSGDKVQITTFGETSLSGTFDVSGAGTISFPLIGEVVAKGLTTAELSKSVENSLREGYIKNPSVSIEVLTYRPFYILGEVNKPGEYPYTNGLTVLNAVATANGFTYRANTHHVLLKRANESSEHDVELSPSTPVEPGDTIRVKERYF